MFGTQKFNSEHKIHTLRCPVGGEVLGERKLHEDKIRLCRDCRYEYHWLPGIEKPVPVAPTKKGGSCGCGRCGR